MRQQGLQPAVITYNALFSAWVNGIMTERALPIFDVIRQQGLQPAVITYNALTSACAKLG